MPAWVKVMVWAVLPVALTEMGPVVPVTEALTLSVAVTVWVPGVASVTLKVCVPLSPATKG